MTNSTSPSEVALQAFYQAVRREIEEQVNSRNKDVEEQLASRSAELDRLQQALDRREKALVEREMEWASKRSGTSPSSTGTQKPSTRSGLLLSLDKDIHEVSETPVHGAGANKADSLTADTAQASLWENERPKATQPLFHSTAHSSLWGVEQAEVAQPQCANNAQAVLRGVAPEAKSDTSASKVTENAASSERDIDESSPGTASELRSQFEKHGRPARRTTWPPGPRIADKTGESVEATEQQEDSSMQFGIDGSNPGTAGELKRQFERRQTTAFEDPAKKTWQKQMMRVSLPNGAGTTSVHARGADGGAYRARTAFRKPPPEKKTISDLP